MIYSNFDKPIVAFYLLEIKSGDCYFAHMELPIKKFTIEEYEIWNKKYIHNAISLTNTYPPQLIKHDTINEVISINEIWESSIEHYIINLSKKHKDTITPNFKNDISYYINQKFDFRKLLMFLYSKTLKNDISKEKNKLNIYDYKHWIIEFYLIEIKKAHKKINKEK